MGKRFEQKWKNKIPEKYREWTAEELSKELDAMFLKMTNMTPENGYTFDDIDACMAEHKELIQAYDIMCQYLQKKETKLFKW